MELVKLFKRIANVDPKLDYNLDSATPEFCVQLLVYPNQKLFSKLSRKIKLSNKQWLEQFILANGLYELLLCIEKLSKRQKNILNTIKLTQCIACIKEIIEHKFGMESMITMCSQEPKYLEILAKTSMTDVLVVKQDLFKLLTSFCQYYELPEGHRFCLDLLGFIKNKKHVSSKFNVILDEMKNTKVSVNYITTFFGFLNVLILINTSLIERINYRNELASLRFQLLLEDLKKTNDVDLLTQIRLFFQWQENDESIAFLKNGIDLNNAQDLFNGICAKLKQKNEHHEKFVQILQLMYTTNKCDDGANLTEKHLDTMWDQLVVVTKNVTESIKYFKKTENESNFINSHITHSSFASTLLSAISSTDKSKTSITFSNFSTKTETTVRAKDSLKSHNKVTSLFKPNSFIDSSLEAKYCSTSSIRNDDTSSLISSEKSVSGTRIDRSKDANKFTPSDSNFANILTQTDKFAFNKSSETDKKAIDTKDIKNSKQQSNVRETARLLSLQNATFINTFKRTSLPMPLPPPPSSSQLITKSINKVPTLLRLTIPICKKKLKTLYWSTLTESNIIHKDNIWMELNSKESPRLDFNRLEELFKTMDTKNVKSVPQKIIAKKVQLLDHKKSMTINIFLLNKSDDFIKQIFEGKNNETTLEDLKSFKKIMPKKSEIELIKSFCKSENDINQLPKAEKFVKLVSDIPDYELKVEALIFFKELDELKETVSVYINKIYECVDVLLNDESLKEFLSLILTCGMFLNKKTEVDQEVGFKIDYLTRLIDFKSTKPSISFLHYVVDEYLKAKNNIKPAFLDKLEKLQLFKKFKTSELKKTLSDFYENASKFLKTYSERKIDDFDIYQTNVSNFQTNLNTLKAEMVKIEEINQKLCDYYHYYNNSDNKVQITELDNLFMIFNDFSLSINKIIQEKQIAIETENKINKRREELECLAAQSNIDTNNDKKIFTARLLSLRMGKVGPNREFTQ